MASTLNAARALRASEMVEQTQPPDAMRPAHSCTLDELLGVIFAIITLGYIVQSLTALAL